MRLNCFSALFRLIDYMRIIISGSGDTGTHLAKMLAAEKQDVVLLSEDEGYLSSIDSTYNLMTHTGSALSPDILSEVGIKEADLFIGVTPRSTRNIVACQLASQMGAKATVARVNEEDLTREPYASAFRQTGVGRMVYPETLVAEDIERYIDSSWALHRYELHGGLLVFSGAKIEATSPLVGKPLSCIGRNRAFHIAAIRRNGKVLIPSGCDIVYEGDIVYFTYTGRDEDQIPPLVGHKRSPIEKVIVTGSGALPESLLQRLQNRRLNVSLISPDMEFCKKMASGFDDISVSHSTVSDIATMIDEGVRQCDLFISLLPYDSDNIVGSLTARQLGAKRTLAQIENLHYIPEAERLGIDKIVNKKLITSGVILQSVMGSDLLVHSMIAMDDAEIAELEVQERSMVAGDMIKDLSIPTHITFGGLLRDSHAEIINGDTRLQPGDLVLVIFRHGDMDKLRKLFRPRHAGKNL